MANILFVESDSIAVKAFTGIINRSAHAMVHVPTVKAAWDALLGDVFYDIVILELKLTDGSGKGLLSSIRKHPFLKRQHVLVYTRVTERETVRQVLLQDVQNYLIKPYEDEKLFIEINRAASSLWWREYFEPKELVCANLDLELDALHDRYRLILKTLGQLPFKAGDWIDNHTVALLKLQKLSEKVGFPVFYDLLCKLFGWVRAERNQEIQTALDSLPVAARLIEEWIERGCHSSASNENARDLDKVEVKRKGMRDTTAVATWEEVQQKINQMEGYPVLDSVGASFQMAARNPDIEVETLVEMIETDPCLSVQVLYYSNCVSKLATRHGTLMDDPKQAIQMLGLTRIRAIAMSLITIPDEDLEFRGFDWRKYWMFQVGSAMLCQDIVRMLSLRISSNIAYFAGIIHELGKIILCYFYPDAYENAIEYAYDTSIPLLETEKHYFGCTHIDVGTYFARNAKLSDSLLACIRNHSDPTVAPEASRELVAVVSLADYLCKYYEVGFSGSRLPRGVHSFAAHPAWTALKPSLYNGFTVARFERACHERVRTLKRELIGLAEKQRF